MEQKACKTKKADSFAPDTPVLLADGSHRAIRDVRTGDHVLATDPETGNTQPKPVTALHRNLDTELADISIRSTNGRRATLETTQNHPFWNNTSKQWTDAAALKPGTNLRTPRGGRATVSTTRVHRGSRYMHNLTVADIHTYYVLVGNAEVLVHNASCQFWSPIDYNGQRIYQRDDLMNPHFVSPVDKYGRTNLKRMQQGLAPMGPDGKPLNLHHMLQTQDGPIAEVTHSMHFDNYYELHWKVGTKIPSGIDRKAFEAWKSQYWKDRAKGLGE
ncbi:HNH/ENDO VII family nuclease [Couchioplanes azureus]|uniref:HNH/ENDO VII family nuclease n=1 Tax=Couchioplanes caeruleus TaxID=56438 RepID=UPI001E465A58|nr:HNH/ENDO VII family nuclease [Couchioplanes caeruleus]